MTGTIVNIQHYAVHDGPGIRTLVFLKGCPLRCPWCCNPETQSIVPQVRYISPRCRKCLVCVKSCHCSSLLVTETAIQRSYEICNKCPAKECIDLCNFDAISVSGREISSDELVEIIARDIPFYKNSGGGVTFSGGEPLMQPAFLLDLLQKCRSLIIHTAVETCGWANKSAFRQILQVTDLFLFDLKIIDPELHLHLTGKPVKPILDNLAYLASENARIDIRFPIIPGITDTPENLSAVAGIMKSFKLQHIYLEPYHTLGRDKYDEHGMDYSLDHLLQCTPEQIKKPLDYFCGKGFYCELV